MDRVSIGIRESASSRHAPVETVSKFRGAGCVVREGVPLMRHLFYGAFAQAELKSPFCSLSDDTKSEDANEKTPEGRETPAQPMRGNCTDAEKYSISEWEPKAPYNLRPKAASFPNSSFTTQVPLKREPEAKYNLRPQGATFSNSWN